MITAAQARDAARVEQLEEAVRVRPSKAAMDALRSYHEAWEIVGDGREGSLACSALALLIAMFDKLPPARPNK